MSVKGIEKLGLTDIKKVYHNLSYRDLFVHEIRNEEAEITTKHDTMNVDTGRFTGRSPDDKFFVRQDPSKKYIAWGETNRAIHEDFFNELFDEAKKQLSGKDIYIQDAYCGASKNSQKKIRVVTEIAWQAHFVKNMFIRPEAKDLADFCPDFTLYNACKFTDKRWAEHGLRKGGDGVFVIFNIEENIAIIGGTWYGGEMKKGIFSMMNYWLPLEGKLGMHCSANIGKENDDVALFFGLSGTGKTTLSTDSKRRLIGDDEHGWDDNGVFNFEGGCYAKCADLREKAEPEIFHAIRKNALLENVTVDWEGNVDFAESASRTPNTRVSYPIEHIDGFQESLSGGHPKNIIFLTADAYGVLPPVAKLNPEQAMYYFLSGYTAKVAGTELGVKEPQPSFSACFGEPFLPLHPTVYAKLLGEKIEKHDVNVYLVNTGWSGGAYGVGKRMSINATRSCINAIFNGSILKSEFENFDIFNLSIPKKIEGVPSKVLDSRNTWKDTMAFDKARVKLAKMFVRNFKKYTEDNSDFDYSMAGPHY